MVWNKFIRIVAIAAALLCGHAVIVERTAAAQADPIAFNIRAQPLDSALVTFSQQSGVQIVTSGSLLENRSSAAVSGELTPTQALDRMLAGSGLTHQFTGPSTATLAATASQESAGPIALNPLTVTGERVERTVFETPSSVAVTTGDEIDRTPQLKEVLNVLERTPNVTFGGRGNNGVFIRGVNTTGVLSGGFASFGGARPRATITLDGRPLSFNEYIFGLNSIYDAERVEVFRGPQTTSQGVNSIAGATYVVTRDPTFTPEADALVEAGNFKRRRGAAMASGPIVEDELAARVTLDYQERESFVFFPTNLDYGADPNQLDSLALRGKLLWEPAALPELSTKLTLSYNESTAPQSEAVRLPFDDLVSNVVNSAVFETRAITGIHDLNYEIGAGLEFRNRFSVSHYEAERFITPNGGNGLTEGLEFINEASLVFGGPGGRLTGLVGTHFRHSDQDEDTDFGAAGGAFKDKNTSIGVFGEATYAVTDRLDVTLGLRYQRDRQDRDGAINGIGVDFDETFDAFLPKASIAYDVTDNARVGVQVSRGFNPGGTTIFFFNGQQDRFEEETVWNYEVFARTNLLDDRLMLNANAFYSDYYDFQKLSITDFDAFGNPIVELDNVDRARSYGAEINASFQAVDEVRFFGGLGLLDTELVKTSFAGDPAEGNEFALAPHVTFTGGIEVTPFDGLSFGGQVRYAGEYFSDDDNTAANKAGDYWVADAQARYAYENVEAYAYVANIFDEFAVQRNFGTVANVLPPREVGVGLRVRF